LSIEILSKAFSSSCFLCNFCFYMGRNTETAAKRKAPGMPKTLVAATEMPFMARVGTPGKAKLLNTKIKPNPKALFKKSRLITLAGNLRDPKSPKATKNKTTKITPICQVIICHTSRHKISFPSAKLVLAGQKHLLLICFF